MSEIHAVFSEKIFSAVSTHLPTCPRGNLSAQTIGVSRKFTTLFLLSAQQKKIA